MLNEYNELFLCVFIFIFAYKFNNQNSYGK